MLIQLALRGSQSRGDAIRIVQRPSPATSIPCSCSLSRQHAPGSVRPSAAAGSEPPPPRRSSPVPVPPLRPPQRPSRRSRPAPSVADHLDQSVGVQLHQPVIASSCPQESDAAGPPACGPPQARPESCSDNRDPNRSLPSSRHAYLPCPASRSCRRDLSNLLTRFNPLKAATL